MMLVHSMTQAAHTTPGPQQRPTWSAQVWDPEAAADTSTEGNHHKHKLTPYKDMDLRGKVLATFVRGHQVFDAVKGVAPAVCGGPVTRKWQRVALPSRGKAAPAA